MKNSHHKQIWRKKNNYFFGFKIQKCGKFPKFIKKNIVQLRFEYVVDTQNTFHDDENPLHNLFFCRKNFIYVKIQIFKFSKLQKLLKKGGIIFQMNILKALLDA